jgi:hypothetical protein
MFTISLGMEIFKDITGYEGIYQVSNFGNIKSLKRVIMRSDNRPRTIPEKIKVATEDHGYKKVGLHDKDGTARTYTIHRLVMKMFVGDSPLYVDHIDGNKWNNRLDNLRYVTNSENLTFRNTDTQFKSGHPYVYHDKKRNEYRVYKYGPRLKTFEEAKAKAICLYGPRQ